MRTKDPMNTTLPISTIVKIVGKRRGKKMCDFLHVAGFTHSRGRHRTLESPVKLCEAIDVLTGHHLGGANKLREVAKA